MQYVKPLADKLSYGDHPFLVYGTVIKNGKSCFVLWDYEHEYFITAPVDDFKPYILPAGGKL